MKFQTIVCVFLATSFLITGCISTEEHEATKKKLEREKSALQAQIDRLKLEIDELKNGAPRLFARGKLDFKAGKLDDSQTSFETILKRHPEYENISIVHSYLAKIKDERKRILAEKKAAEIQRIEKEKRKKAAEKKRMEAALSGMVTYTDKVEGITWYHSKSFDRGGPSKPVEYSILNEHSPLRLYIGQGSSHPWLRMRLSYSNKNWLFIQKAAAYVDGETYILSTQDFDRKQNQGVYDWLVSEWVDIFPKHSDLMIIESIINSNEALIRFYGKHSVKDILISQKDKKGLQEVLDAFRLLGGQI